MSEKVRREVLEEAEKLVNRARNNEYGPPDQDFTRTAAMWEAYLGVEVKSHDVAAMMGMLKLSRIRWAPEHRDNWVDLAGYAACGADCVHEARLRVKEDEAWARYEADDEDRSGRSFEPWWRALKQGDRLERTDVAQAYFEGMTDELHD